MSDIESKELLELKKQEIAQMEQITTDIISSANTTNEKADEMYSFMSDLIDIEADKSEATRNMMGKALEIKLLANSQKIEILKIKAKMLVPGSAGTNVNINLGEYDDKKGSDTNNMIEIVEGLRRARTANAVECEENEQ